MDTLTKADIQEIVTATLGQRSNSLWLTMRRGRLTASSFGRVLQLARSCNPIAIAKFRKDTFSPCDLSRVPAIKWGVEHEADAIAEYERETGFRVMPTGLWLFEDGYLGASPNGMVYNGDTLVGILEVKCPWSIRNRCFESTADWLAYLSYLTRPKCLPRNLQYSSKFKVSSLLPMHRGAIFSFGHQTRLYVLPSSLTMNGVKHLFLY